MIPYFVVFPVLEIKKGVVPYIGRFISYTFLFIKRSRFKSFFLEAIVNLLLTIVTGLLSRKLYEI
jgi:hypothetical protein